MSRHVLIAIDLIAIGVLVFALYFPRHRRKDLVAAYLGVNIGVLAVANALNSSGIEAGLGLGLFGVLSIIRLRSAELDQEEVAYFFSSLALGLLGGLSVESDWLMPALMAAIVAALYIGDHPRLYAGYRTQVVRLNRAFTSEAALRTHLEGLLGATVHRVKVRKVDLVSDTTSVEVRYRIDSSELTPSTTNTSDGRRRTRKAPALLGAALLALVLVISGCGAAGLSQVVGDSGSSGEADSGSAEPATGSDAGATDSDTATSDSETTISPDTSAVTTANQQSHVDADDLEYDESDVVEITLDATTATADSERVTIDGSRVSVIGGGVYSISGTLSDGQVIVDAADSDDVTLVLDGVDITNSDGAAIAVMSADEAVIILADGTTNQLTDGGSYTFPDAETDEPNATLYSTADLAIAGNGELTVNANFNDGIASKDGLVIESGAISVSAIDDGVRGKDYVIINGGAMTIEAGGDGIKSDNDDDADRGYVLISNGLLDITSGDDGVQAQTDVLVTGGDVAIDAGASSQSGRAIQGDVMVLVSGGVIDATAGDDAIHSNNEIQVDGGTLTLAAGDDGIHGDYLVTINGGSISITQAFEGIESEVIVINDGLIDVTSNDDGLNVASAEATTASAAGGARGGPRAENVGEHYVYIHGGTTTITITGQLNEQGDGIDANGHIVMTGGVVAISGPTDTRNSALDYSGGSFEMTGGTFIGMNIDGRNSEGIGIGSSQASLYLTSGTPMSAGTVVHVETGDGDNLITFDPENDFSVIVFSSPDLVDGGSYDVYLGGMVTEDSPTNLYDTADYTPGELAATVVATR